MTGGNDAGVASTDGPRLEFCELNADAEAASQNPPSGSPVGGADEGGTAIGCKFTERYDSRDSSPARLSTMENSLSLRASSSSLYCCCLAWPEGVRIGAFRSNQVIIRCVRQKSQEGGKRGNPTAGRGYTCCSHLQTCWLPKRPLTRLTSMRAG